MKILKLIILTVFTLSFISCEEDFNPYGDYQEKYAFTCILKNDDGFQTATLLKSYLTTPSDPSVIGADVRVWYNDSVFVFRDSSVARTDTSRYNTPFSFYYNRNFRVSNDKPIELEVILPNGKRLRSSSVTPKSITFDDDSEVLIPPVSSNIIQFLWNTFNTGTYFAPRLTIRYKQNVNGEIIEKTKIVPVEYVEQNGEMLPVYPLPTSSPAVVYGLDAVTKALQEISEGDPDKQNYSILQKVSFSVYTFDLAVSKYISSTGGSFDDLTVSVDVADYTNIQGGFGLFGSYSKKSYTKLRFLQSYIETFGYNFIVEN
ncbi:MAG: hypothetical protein ACHQLA_07765 [Ignavibacteriales bacterium]